MTRLPLVLVVVLADLALPSYGRTVREESIILDAVKPVGKPDDKFGSNVSVSNACNENCGKTTLEMSNEESGRKQQCPYERKELCLIFALSKIAKVQLADPNHRAEAREFRAKVFDDAQKNTQRPGNYLKTSMNGEYRPATIGQNARDGHLQNSSTDRASNVHCRAIRDIYIPEVKQKLPAFACKYENRMFVLSSERFLQDRRTFLDISVDDSTFRNIGIAPKVSRSNDFSLVPALLVLRAGDNNYKIRTPGNITKQRAHYAGEDR